MRPQPLTAGRCAERSSAAIDAHGELKIKPNRSIDTMSHGIRCRGARRCPQGWPTPARTSRARAHTHARTHAQHAHECMQAHLTRRLSVDTRRSAPGLSHSGRQRRVGLGGSVSSARADDAVLRTLGMAVGDAGTLLEHVDGGRVGPVGRVM